MVGKVPKHISGGNANGWLITGGAGLVKGSCRTWWKMV